MVAVLVGSVKPEKLGFVMVEAEATEVSTGDNVAATCAFIRGDSVAVFVHASVVDGDGDEVGSYIILTDQTRFPMGKRLREACAGCVDSNTGKIAGVALNELKEELGVEVSLNDLTPLGSFIPSGGGTFEEIHLYYTKIELSEEQYREKMEKTFGDGPSEKIRLVFEPVGNFDSVLDDIGDAKAECAWRRILNRGLITRQVERVGGGRSSSMFSC